LTKYTVYQDATKLSKISQVIIARIGERFKKVLKVK